MGIRYVPFETTSVPLLEDRRISISRSSPKEGPASESQKSSAPVHSLLMPHFMGWKEVRPVHVPSLSMNTKAPGEERLDGEAPGVQGTLENPPTTLSSVTGPVFDTRYSVTVEELSSPHLP